MGDIKITSSSELGIKGLAGKEPVHIAALSIQEFQNIAPVPAHIKEVNHIDPLSIEALHVSQVKNIEPITVEKFNITDLPMVNMSLRQLPPVDINVRRLPPVSISTHQDFYVPSSYTVRARILGIEFLRIHVDGHTMIIPKERYRREQERTQSRSFPLTAAAGNPAIPSKCYEESAATYHPAYYPRPMQPNPGGGPIVQATSYQQRANPMNTSAAYTGLSSSLNFGLPGMNFPMSGTGSPGAYGGSTVSSGG